MDSSFRAVTLQLASFVLCSLFVSGVSVGSPMPAVAAVQPDVLVASPEDQLSQCVEVAKSGKVKDAYLTAVRLREEFGSQLDVSYINTLLTIAEQADSSLEPKILNEVISLVNKVRAAKTYDGVQDAKTSFHFMNALGRLSKQTLDVNETISCKVRIYEGLVALNLGKNPSFPKSAMEALAKPLVSMAQGYAIRGDKENAFKALRVAVDKGFGDFDMVLKDPLLNRLGKLEIAKLTSELRVRYKKSVRIWARAVVADFPTTQLYFDLPNIEGGRLSNADFAGKVLVMDLWATWCPPCRRGIPHFIKLQEAYGDRNVSVFGVSMDNPKNSLSAIDTVRKFASEQKFNYPCAMGDTGFSQSVPGESILPTTVFMDSMGNVRFIARGYHDYAKLEAITDVLVNESQPIRTTLPSLSN